ncbi:radical SAM/SPASM domain-containing protein [Pseudobacteroides cellulosolvens]|uniref:4Fe4S-binding SPASM domain containing protein n=1 Tax=Pseudobacteroides cellulosolvens ATCC 35603 = DSM 2933 TaxID=398512 RepID=A0A0L6JSZ4_9FIRM|nr:radical SAM protein [Pseudobacteroides cellulosolvens]KNY28938.1 4Fe4S-binding SPASM domain containing protein [Pseudobacteroides cellulosolvens ATCC 35603 = DSM 2933]
MDKILENRFYTYQIDDKYFYYDSITSVISESTIKLNSTIERLKHENIDTIKNNAMKEQDIETYKYISKLEKLIKSTDYLCDNGVQFTRKKAQVKNLADDTKTCNTLWLSISHTCNMNCIYCFGQGGNYGGPETMMSKETAKESIDLFFSKVDNNTKRIKVNFFGGEPLTNKKVLIYSVDYINKVAVKKGIKVKYLIDTNGTLLDDEIINVFIENNFEVIISIDGVEEIQNKNRPLRIEGNSFEIIMNNVRKLNRLNKKVTARMTLTKDAMRNFKKSVFELWDRGFSYIFFEMVSTSMSDLKVTGEDLEEFRQQLSEVAEVTYKNIISGIDKEVLNLTKKFDIIHKRNIGTECSYYSPYTLMFTPEGEIYNCFWMFGKEEHKIGTIKHGICKSVRDRVYKEDDMCRACWAKRICGGGCLCKEITHSGEKEDNFEVYCNQRKIVIAEVLKLYTKLSYENALANICG